MDCIVFDDKKTSKNESLWHFVQGFRIVIGLSPRVDRDLVIFARFDVLTIRNHVQSYTWLVAVCQGNLISMSSIPASTADTEAQAALTALQAADNATFILETDAAIVEMISQGKAQVSVSTFGNVLAKTIVSYYVNLGYKVVLPDYPQSLEIQPAQLFGQFWVEFWDGTLSNTLGFNPSKNPVRLLISW